MFNEKKPIIVGIISEYNPFHNGHLYHIQKTKEILNPDYVICVMSGNYTQRGEPALVSKRVRTECALRSGIDLVIELPFIYATSSAEFFSQAGVSILNSLGCVTHISFGCETPNVKILEDIANILADEPEEYVQILKKYLSEGLGFAAARENALRETLLDLPENAISGSNNILAIEYIKSLKKFNSSIKPLPIRREGASYTDINIKNIYPSAMAIRNELKKSGCLDNIRGLVPDCTYSLLHEEFYKGRCPLKTERLNDYFQIYLRSIKRNTLNDYPFIEPGLDNRLLNTIKISKNVEDIINRTVSKRYPATRIRRLLLNILSGLTKDDFNLYVKNPVPYARVLGFNTNKSKILGILNKNSDIPIIVKTSDIKSENKMIQDIFDYEIRTSDIYQYLFPKIGIPYTSEFEYQPVKV